ncbi:MAG: hormogonium polysaccharide secretion pseudopilin HpsC [Cyanobacteria bacterium P01_H01_bin.15]
MIDQLLRIGLRPQRQRHSKKGFTLVELLVASILSSLVIAPIVGVISSVLISEKNEEVKSKSQQELQNALAFIERDVEQAFYIYDQAGLSAITGDYSTSICSSAGSSSCTNIPVSNDRIPVLAFWKRDKVGGVPAFDPAGLGSSWDEETFVYTLVVYYLTIDNNTTWSDAARITRWEISDGARFPNGALVPSPATTSTSTCPQDGGFERDCGFQLFDFDEGQPFDTRMQQWTKVPAETFTARAIVLVDYIDQSDLSNADVQCKFDPRFNPSTCLQNAGADICPANYTQVPDYNNSGVGAKFKTLSFFACVNDDNFTAQIFLRGNSLARLPKSSSAVFSESNELFFPTERTEVRANAFVP